MTLRELTFDSSCVVRTAAKPWHCICAKEIRSYGVRRDYKTHDGGDAWSETRATEEDFEDLLARYRADHPNDAITLVEHRNPEYRSDCLVEIAVGDEYIEYLGDSAMWESGSRYCARCGVAVWAIKETS